eukprot:2961409-Amphidinium_carterae.1
MSSSHSHQGFTQHTQVGNPARKRVKHSIPKESLRACKLELQGCVLLGYRFGFIIRVRLSTRK